MTQKILITGGAGFIGWHLVDSLIKRGEAQIRVLDNLNHPNTDRVKELYNNPSIEFIEGDVRNPAALLKAAEGCDSIFHLAAQSNVMRAESDPIYAFDTNVSGTFYLLQAAKTQGVSQIVFTSSREVYGNPSTLPVCEETILQPQNIYGTSKVTGEFICKFFRQQYNLDVRVVRLSNVYGPGDRDRVIPLFCQAILTGQPLTIYGGKQLIDFVWIDDAIRALVEISQLSVLDQPVNIGSGSGITVAELAQTMCQLSNQEMECNVLPGRDVEVDRFIADNTRMRELLGWAPMNHVVENLSRVLDSYCITWQNQ